MWCKALRRRLSFIQSVVAASVSGMACWLSLYPRTLDLDLPNIHPIDKVFPKAGSSTNLVQELTIGCIHVKCTYIIHE